MSMIDMKRPKPPKKEESKLQSVGPSFEPYPPCLQISLEEPELKALGLSPKNFNTKMSGELTAAYDVIEVRDIERKDQDPWDSPKRVRIQIKKLDLGKLMEQKPGKFDQAQSQKNAGPGE
jgi:hypothetical protein